MDMVKQKIIMWTLFVQLQLLTVWQVEEVIVVGE